MRKSIVKRVAAAFLTVPLYVGMATTPMLSFADSSVLANAMERVWDFEDGTQNWAYDDSWSGGGYNGGGSCVQDSGMLKVSLDFSKDVNNGWSQTGISIWEDAGIDYSAFTTLTFDLYYDSAAYTTGQITIKIASDNVFQEQMSGINQMQTEDVPGTTLKKATFTFECDPTYAQTEKPQKLLLLIVGNSTDYKGDLWFDNIRLTKVETEDIFVDATETPDTNTALTGTNTALTVNETAYPYAGEVQLVDSEADAATVAVYQYLKAVGESSATLYGHMEDTVLKAGTSVLSYSDTKDLTGSISAIVGLDCGNLFDGFADKYNARHPEAEPIPTTIEGNIKAAALLSNEDIAEGAIMTLSAHMPNFAYSEEKDMTSEKTYDRYDFLKADSYNLTGDCMNQILPGGQYHDRYNAYLDMVAEYANQVNGPILFRPLHENTGSWFWWGKAFCDAETYKSVFKYTVEYLRDEKDVHNLIYVYGPGSEAASLEEYAERYPGDEYVDMVGFDTYDSNPVTDEEGYTFQTNFENVVKLVDSFAKQHNKLFAVTETGITSDKGGLPDTGNKRKEWFTEILDIVTKEEYNCAYFMTWSNYSKTGSYYTPFVDSVKSDGTWHGHEMMDNFIRFYNNAKSIFAADQKDILASQQMQVPTKQEWSTLSGYITAPISGSRVLSATAITGRINQAGADVTFAVAGEGNELRLPTTVNGKVAEAVLTAENLASLGETAKGKIILYAGDTKLQEISAIFNIAEQEKDPHLVDNFESYYGVDSLLTGSWAINKDSGSDLKLYLVQDPCYEGSYALKFDYTETSTGWAGATIKNEADWSDCNALQFWVVPDGKNQKTVIQINTEDGGSYEAYLNNYEGYTSTTKPLLVTMPFSEFIDKGDRGALTSAAAAHVSNFGLWLNAIPGSDAIDAENKVSGTLYYDAIQAVYTESSEPIFELVDAEDPKRVWDFENSGLDGWEMAGTYDYAGKAAVSYDSETIGSGALKLSVEYDSGISWSEVKIQNSNAKLAGATSLSCDFYYKPEAMTTGSFTMKASNNETIDVSNAVTMEGELLENGYRKGSVTLQFDPTTQEAGTLVLGIVGVMTDYTGDILLDNITLYETEPEDTRVMHTVRITGGTAVAGVEDVAETEGITTGKAEDTTKVTVKANDSNAGQFQYWTVNGVISSYDAQYTFYITGDVEIVAVYGETEPEKEVIIQITNTIVDSNQKKISFVAERNIPDGNTVVEHGIIVATRELTEDNFQIGSSGVKKGTASTKGLVGTYRLNISNVPEGRSVYARGYLTYQDKDGVSHTLYTAIAQGTME